MSAQRVPKGIQMGAKWNPNGSKMAPWKPLGAPWPPAGLLERSGKALGPLLEPNNKYWHRLLASPRAPRRLVSHCLGAKYTPKRSPGGSQNRGPKAIQAQNGKTLIFNDTCKDLNDF